MSAVVRFLNLGLRWVTFFGVVWFDLGDVVWNDSDEKMLLSELVQVRFDLGDGVAWFDLGDGVLDSNPLLKDFNEGLLLSNPSESLCLIFDEVKFLYSEINLRSSFSSSIRFLFASFELAI